MMERLQFIRLLELGISICSIVFILLFLRKRERNNMKFTSLTKKRLDELASATKLKVDNVTGIIFGKRQTYDVCLRVMNNSYKALVSISVSKDGKVPLRNDFLDLVKESKALESVNVNGFSVSFVITPGFTKGSSVNKIAEGINDIINFMSLNHFRNCCESCGKLDGVDTYILSGNEYISCSDCYDKESHGLALNERENRKSENIFAGIVGALLGSVIGAITIIIFGQLGYVSAISGFVLAICSIKGYELFSKKLSNFGIIFSIVIALVMTYVGSRFDMAISIMSILKPENISIFTAFAMVSEDSNLFDLFVENLIQLYIFVAIGMIPCIISEIRSRKNKTVSRKLQA